MRACQTCDVCAASSSKLHFMLFFPRKVKHAKVQSGRRFLQFQPNDNTTKHPDCGDTTPENQGPFGLAHVYSRFVTSLHWAPPTSSRSSTPPGPGLLVRTLVDGPREVAVGGCTSRGRERVRLQPGRP